MLTRETAEIQKSSDFWFKYGDFILIADDEVAYRIHSDVLGRKSKVFNDLLDHDVSHSNSGETMDDCPVVHISDTPGEFDAFLRLIYDGFSCATILSEALSTSD